MKNLVMLVLLAVAQAQANPTISQARQLLAKQPDEVIRLYNQAAAELTSAPAWLQRDWHVLATSAFVQQRQWPQASKALVAADHSLMIGMSAAEIALLAGTVAYQQQQLHSAWYWFRCANVFNNPPETAARLTLNLGVMASRHHQEQQALAYYQQGLALTEAHNFERLFPLYYNNLGVWHWRHGELVSAERFFRKALYSHSRQSGIEAQARAMLNLLFVQASAKQWDKFDRYLRETAVLIKKQPNADYPIVLTVLQTLRDYNTQTNDDAPAQLQALAASIKGASLQQSVQLLLAQHHIVWQPTTSAFLPEPLLPLPNTRAQCATVPYDPEH